MALVALMRPVVDGFEFARRRRRAEAADPSLGRLAMIALSARLDDDEMTRCRAAGFDDCLAKPLEIAEAARLIRRWMSAIPNPAMTPAKPEPSCGEDIDLARFRANLRAVE